MPGWGRRVFALKGDDLLLRAHAADVGAMQPGMTPNPNRSIEQRRCGRVRVHMIRTDLGELRDLCSHGARVLCRCGVPPPQPGEKFWFNIEGVDGGIRVSARVVWSRKCGWFGRELGLEFLGLDEQTRAALASLARTAASNQILGLDAERRASA